MQKHKSLDLKMLSNFPFMDIKNVKLFNFLTKLSYFISRSVNGLPCGLPLYNWINYINNYKGLAIGLKWLGAVERQ